MNMTKARFTKLLPVLTVLAVVLVVGLFPHDAFAQKALDQDWACKGDRSLNTIFCGITNQFSTMPKLLSVFAYVIAAVLTFKGLLQLKEFGDDPSKTPIQSVIMKFALAGMLACLPLAMQVFITTVTGAKDVSAASALSRKPSLGNRVSGK